MDELLSFLVLISAGLFLSEIFRRFHLPYVIGLIIAGILIGPYGMSILRLNGTIDFLGTIGLVFLMFMAGLGIKSSSIIRLKGKVARISLLNGAIPFAVGFLIGNYFGYGFLASMLLGIIFISSSIAIIIPSLEANRLLDSSVGKAIVASTVVEDALSLVFLSIVLQTLNPTSALPLPLFYLLLLFILVAMKIILPKADRMLFSGLRKKGDLFEHELRFIFVSLIAVVVIFDLLGLHAIIAGFFAGLVLADTVRSEVLRDKLHAMSYGLFIPIFFIIIGMETDITVFYAATGAIALTAAIISGSMISKFSSGWIAGRLCGFNSSESSLVGASTIPQLSTTLAVAFVGLEFNIIDHKLITAMVILSVVTTFAGPFLMRWACPKCKLPEKKKK